MYSVLIYLTNDSLTDLSKKMITCLAEPRFILPCKQCKPKSDASEEAILSGSTMFAI